MLVLTRKSGEGIRIGDEIRVVVVDIKENQVKLGIEAPSQLSVHRDEIYIKIKEENIIASKVALSVKAVDKISDAWRKRLKSGKRDDK